MSLDTNSSSEHAIPYERLEGKLSHVVTKLRVLRAVQFLLCGIVIMLVISLFLSIGSNGRSSCVWPGPGSRCFWPFGRHHPLVLISMDGFRHDYLELVRKRFGANALPNFARLQSRGVRALHSINAFPTVTMPNHQTLVTGLYAESHGIVGNTVLDTRWPNVIFEMGNQTSLNDDPWLVDWPEPIWVTLQRSGGLAASHLWPLSDQPVHGDLPFQQVSQYTLLDSNAARYPYEKRVADLLWWLHNPRYQLDLILSYFDEPDETGHAYGPESEQVARKVVELDGVLGQLLDGLNDRGLLDSVDIVLTADHGMASISHERLIALDTFVDPSDYVYTQLSTVGILYPRPGKETEVYSKLHGAHPHLSVYHLSDVPEYLHFSHNNSRMPPLVLIPDPSWYLVHQANQSTIAGNHGYSTNFSDMHPFLIASGPSFLVNATVEEVHAVDLYPLICRLLRFRPQPNNGSLERGAKALLKPAVAYRLLAFDSWPSWLFWLTLEVELLWFLFTLTALSGVISLLVLSVRLHRRYDTLHVVVPKPDSVDPMV